MTLIYYKECLRDNDMTDDHFKISHKSEIYPIERRRAKRIKCDLDGTMKYYGKFMRIGVLNISVSGAYVSAPVKPEVDELVTIIVNGGEKVYHVSRNSEGEIVFELRV